jgi:peptide/nickel transport system substrate-binding protein
MRQIAKNKLRLRISGWQIIALPLLMLVGCGEGALTLPTAGPSPAPTPSPTPIPFKSELVICTISEPDAIIGSANPVARAIRDAVAPQPAQYVDDFSAENGTLLTKLPTETDGSLTRDAEGHIVVILTYRDGLVWSDGVPFSAADAALGMNTPAAVSDPAFTVKDTEIVDDQTVRVTLLAAEYPYVPSQPPLPSHVVTKDNINTYLKSVSPALGAYYVSEWIPGQSIVLRANPYYAPAPLIPVVRFRFTDSPDQAVSDLGSGACDVVMDDSLRIDQYEALLNLRDSRLIRFDVRAGNVRDDVVLNTTPGAFGRTPYFADVRVGQAVAYALNREILGKIWQGVSPVQDGWLPPSHWANEPAGLTHYGYDPDRAAALLDASGWVDQNGDGVREYHGEGGEYTCQRGSWELPEGTPLAPVLVYPSDPLRKQMAESVRVDLARIGISVQMQAIDATQLFTLDGPVTHRDFDMALLSAVARPDPGGINQWLGADVFLHPLDHVPVHRWELEDRWRITDQLVERLASGNVPDQENGYRGQNTSGWCNEEADITLVKANLSFDAGERKALYARHQQLFSADVPVVPLFYRLQMAASASYVCGTKPNGFAPITWNLAQWYFDPTGQCSTP